MSIITLTTDFGTSDHYVAQMKGVILGINPQATIVDISHSIAPQDILQGAGVIGEAHRSFPAGTIHVVVVDPGVGTGRRPILLSAPSAHFVGPDNGVLSHILSEGFGDSPQLSPQIPEDGTAALPNGFRGFHLNNPDFWRGQVSRTFHGRDIFAPVAAHLSLGVLPANLGSELARMVYMPPPSPYEDGGFLVGVVTSIDHYGNLITNVPAKLVASHDRIEVQVKGRTIHGLSQSYQEAEHLLAIIGSGGYLEIAVKNGSAAETLAAQVGLQVRVSARPPT